LIDSIVLVVDPGRDLIRKNLLPLIFADKR